MPEKSITENPDKTNFSSHTSLIKEDEKTKQILTILFNHYSSVDHIKNADKKNPVRDISSQVGKDLDQFKTWLSSVHKIFSEDSKENLSLTFASEWVLDNYYIIRQTLQQIEEDLPSGYYQQLPQLREGALRGYPRIYAMARTILADQNLIADPNILQKILIEFQKKTTLTIGEVWAFPIFLRYSLIEFLAHTLLNIINPTKQPQLPDMLPFPEGIPNLLPDINSDSIETDASNSIANIILSLRTITDQDWKDFFEAVSCPERTLRKEPAGIYAQMDFKTRDHYRNEIEKLAAATRIDECELAEKLVNLSETSAHPAHVETPPEKKAVTNQKSIHYEHIGIYLFGERRGEFEAAIGYKPDFKTKFNKWLFKHATSIYLSIIAILTIILLFLLALAANVSEILTGMPFSTFLSQFNSTQIHVADPILWVIAVLIGLLMVVPALTVATSLVNWFITISLPPRKLPKLDFKGGLPDEFKTLVVIPALLSNEKEIHSLVRQLELHYLRNPQPGLKFAILTDYIDADQESLANDADLVNIAKDAIAQLNEKYKGQDLGGLANHPGDLSADVKDIRKSDELFYFLHRKRLWNPSEGKWMGWERKRGKLHELNRLLRGEKGLSFIQTVENNADIQSLQDVRFVITLDADTIMPLGAAKRLVGTLAHPLNQPVIDPATGKVISGYTVLQPRVEVHPKSTNFSWFTKLYAGDTGLDLYTLAVSDVYQDLFGEGSYVGKGIYDIDAFERCVGDHIPENTILSHDLLEGVLGRAGLVTDITLVEDYPPHYLAQIMRQRRWIRGDWQLLPWLFKADKNELNFSIIDRWKIFDNLRRSLLAPSLLLIFVLGLIFLPGLSGLWTAILMITPAIPLLTGLTHSSIQIMAGEPFSTALHPLGKNLLRWLLAIAFMVYEAYIAFDAIVTTLYRLFISRRNMLQWTTAAQTARIFGLQSRRSIAWQKMGLSVLTAIILTIGVQLIASLSGKGFSTALLISSSVLLLWLLSPIIVFWINQPIIERSDPLDEEQEYLLRQVVRRTWGFFERFVGPEDHWLPPDHFQETPNGIVAHRTSPTNIGLLLTSTLAAYDFGYLDQFGLVTRLSNTVETLEKLERHRGHFLNWYDTISLQPLQPRYVSTVDSGNLAACFIVTRQACLEITEEPIFRWSLWQGYIDTLSNLVELLNGLVKTTTNKEFNLLKRNIKKMRDRIVSIENLPEQWYPLYLHISGAFWLELSQQLLTLVKTNASIFNQKTLAQLEAVSTQIERHHNAVERTIRELVPWIPLLENIPEILHEEKYSSLLSKLQNNLPYNLTLQQLPFHIQVAYPLIENLQSDLDDSLSDNSQEQNKTESIEAQRKTDLSEWLSALKKALGQAKKNVEELDKSFKTIANQLENYVDSMDFQFLYNSQRRVFHIGLNLDAGILDNNFYDLLASEARTASIVAIAKGDVPQTHWLHLNRPVTRIKGNNILLSWSGTMFEYLMPPLFLRSYPGTLLSQSSKGMVQRQIAYGKSKGVPWGISESGFYRFDGNQNYQYRAFGVPGLGFKRGLEDDLVISPYASLMAIKFDPHAVLHNIKKLIKNKMFGLYGMFEAIDFTDDRLLLDEKFAIVAEYMAHHQGMILMAMANYFQNDVMVRRMHKDARIQSVELLMQEQVPTKVELQTSFTENVAGIQRQPGSPLDVAPWDVPVQSSIPQMHLLSNGNYNVLISNKGTGYSSWHETDLTRWQPDSTLDQWGNWIYLEELKRKKTRKKTFWSVAHQPIGGNAEDIQVTYHAHMAVFQRKFNDIFSSMEVTVAPDDPIEIRRIYLLNKDDRARQLRITSYGEVILAPQATDAQHPAFNKLFIESEFMPDLNLQIFKRRPRSKDEEQIWMGHMLIAEKTPILVKHEADRKKFIGRGRDQRNPIALSSQEYLSGSSGATLDPIFSIGYELTLAAHESTYFAYMTLAAESREKLIDLAMKYQIWTVVERAFHQSDISAVSWLSKNRYTTEMLKNTLYTLSALMYPLKDLRASIDILSSNSLGQRGLWRFGISGDRPILLVNLEDPQEMDLVRDAIRVYRFLRTRQFKIDVVILNQQESNYGADVNAMLNRLLSKMNVEDYQNQRGGIFILYSDQMNSAERTLLQSAARVVLSGQNGSLANQIPGYQVPVHHLPEFTATRDDYEIENKELLKQSALSVKQDLLFFNGYGGFSPDGREYIIDITPGNPTPAPWVNVIGYPNFGFMVSETGSQTTWAVNSGENRITPWSNDPVTDPSGEVLYLRDEESGQVWTPTPKPAGTNQRYRVRHGTGYTIFEHNSHGLKQRLQVFGTPEDPVKIIRLKLENTLDQARRITATQYIEWVLGTTRAEQLPYIIPEYDTANECLMARNPYNPDFGEQVAFLIASKPVHGLTADRTEFLGRAGNLSKPIALKRIGLETRIAPGEDVCAALQVHLDLAPRATKEIYFVLGEAENKEKALSLAKKYHQGKQVQKAFDDTNHFWQQLLEKVQVSTPEPTTDMILNRWALYQALSCRIWGRTGFYQSSGAFGFRDQLQDVLALLPIDPTITREQILRAAQHQFAAGDVLHWWHPPSGRGVRTRISDDLLWLPYVTAAYIKASGDVDILNELIQFREADLLKEGEMERYNAFPLSEKSFTLMEHCLRAIEKGSTLGPQGLPLIGSGDWNDGLNRVGEKGRGESVWLAWFLIDVLNSFAEICERQGDPETAQKYRSRATQYAAAVEKSAWDGEWYKRAFYDDGTPLGSAENLEGKIDSIAQSWSVLSQAGDKERSQQALNSVLKYLVRPEDRLILLFTPPFDKTPYDPGYIKGYLPGIRENGGQYTHAAVWTAWAFAKMGEGKQAAALFNLLNPILQSDNQEKADVYNVEPYVVCADIYSIPPLVRHGGWTWYTGSAAWLYRLGLEAILGLEKIENTLKVDPVIPPDWDGFEIRYKFGESLYRIQIKNPEHVSQGIKSLYLDGSQLSENHIPLVDEHREYKVIVNLGKKNS